MISSPPSQSSLLSTDLLAYYRQLSLESLTVVDVETTGSVANDCRVIEVSVLNASLKKGIYSQQTYLVNPQVVVPEMITRFTGITQAMVDRGTPAAEVWTECLPALSTGVLTAHNLEFDYGFLRAEYQRLGIPFVRPPQFQFCTVLLSRLLLADLPSRSLPALVQHFGFEVGASHRAEADTIACWLLSKWLLTQVQNEADEPLLSRFAQQWVRLQDAAIILGCSILQAETILSKAKITFKKSKRGNTTLYPRGEVEAVLWQRGRQLSLS